MAQSSKYGKYSATVKTVTLAAEQAAHGWHLSDGDKIALRNAIEQLEGIL